MQSSEILLIEKLAKGDKEWQKKLMMAFIQQKTIQVKRLQTALWVEDWEEIKGIVHCMKSTFIFIPFPNSLELADSLFHTAGLNAVKTAAEINTLIRICISAIQVYSNQLAKGN